MSNEKHYPVHHTDHENTFPDVGAVYVTKAEFDAMKSERDALQKLVEELKEARRWRKFPDEKPTKDIKFLVINEKGMLQCCYYSLILEEFQIPVTHWMPLPKEPEAVA